MKSISSLKTLSTLIAVLLVSSACGEKPAFKDEVAEILHSRCMVELEKRAGTAAALTQEGQTIEDACSCAVDLLAENYEVIDLTMMGDETLDIVVGNAGRTCTDRLKN
ncbi:MAG: hypothetical protein P8M16_08505 [Acidimicrobiales bacterium]|nr:hypothetical protein [Acidimicrobiales bacterium]